jgi:hypothetical protein
VPFLIDYRNTKTIREFIHWKWFLMKIPDNISIPDFLKSGVSIIPWANSSWTEDLPNVIEYYNLLKGLYFKRGTFSVEP